MPSAYSAAAILVARFTISQMDVPARQAYVVSVVAKVRIQWVYVGVSIHVGVSIDALHIASGDAIL
jgi:hypothetical protein